MMQMLRSYRDVLLIDDDVSLMMYQQRLRQIKDYGMINLHIPTADNESMQKLKSKVRKLMAQLRETKKREDKLNDCVQRFREAKDRAEQESKATKDLLKVVRSQLRAFRLTHPDWRPPPDIEPTTADEDTDWRHIFNIVDKDLDVEAQMKLDPSGVCLTMCVHMCVVYMGSVCVCVCGGVCVRVLVLVYVCVYVHCVIIMIINCVCTLCNNNDNK